MYRFILILHVLGAAVWTGGYLVLALAILPAAVRDRSAASARFFESRFQLVAIPALIVQLVTGLQLSSYWIAGPAEALTASTSPGGIVGVKLLLLAVVAVLALQAWLRLVPRLTERTLGALTWRARVVAIASVLLVIAGVAFRTTVRS